LKEKDVPSERIVLEEKARSTIENFENVKKLVDPDKPLGLITSDYHMDRALRMAKQAGFKQVLPYPSRCPWFSCGANVLWEVIQAINELTFGQ
ncbi:MAG: YdcF family protein, partial [Erysipelotrichaceae bacterium]|nr:YdcF family protein [Erysipelotrichaceae bacterium]